MKHCLILTSLIFLTPLLFASGFYIPPPAPRKAKSNQSQQNQQNQQIQQIRQSQSHGVDPSEEMVKAKPDAIPDSNQPKKILMPETTPTKIKPQENQ